MLLLRKSIPSLYLSMHLMILPVNLSRSMLRSSRERQHNVRSLIQRKKTCVLHHVVCQRKKNEKILKTYPSPAVGGAKIISILSHVPAKLFTRWLLDCCWAIVGVSVVLALLWFPLLWFCLISLVCHFYSVSELWGTFMSPLNHSSATVVFSLIALSTPML